MIANKRTLAAIKRKAHLIGIFKEVKRKVICIETQQIYESVTDAKSVGGPNIIAVCLDKRETAGGYHWAYLDDTTQQEKYKEFIGKDKQVTDWSNEEVEFLIKHYPIEGEKCFSHINRTVGSCRSKVLKLNLSRRNDPWTKDEDDILIKNYPECGPSCFGLIENRTSSACHNRVRQLNLKMNRRPTGDIWTNEEINILKQYYPTMGTSVRNLLPNRTKGAIQRYARLNNIKYTGGSKLLGTTHVPYTQTIKVMCVETGIIYNSIAEAKRENRGHIAECCKDSKKTAGGYHWKYVKEEEKENV